MTVLDGTGTPVKLGTLWRDKPAALGFVRHFGCIHCRQHIIESNRDIDKIHTAGAELHVIGNGSPSFIEGYRNETRWTGPIYSDPVVGTDGTVLWHHVSDRPGDNAPASEIVAALR